MLRIKNDEEKKQTDCFPLGSSFFCLHYFQLKTHQTCENGKKKVSIPEHTWTDYVLNGMKISFEDLALDIENMDIQHPKNAI